MSARTPSLMAGRSPPASSVARRQTSFRCFSTLFSSTAWPPARLAERSSHALALKGISPSTDRTATPPADVLFSTSSR